MRSDRKIVYFLKCWKNVIKTAVQVLIISAVHVARIFTVTGLLLLLLLLALLFFRLQFSFMIHTWPICILIGYLCFCEGIRSLIIDKDVFPLWWWRGGGLCSDTGRPSVSLCVRFIRNADDPPDHNEQSLPGETVALISDRDLTFVNNVWSFLLFFSALVCFLRDLTVITSSGGHCRLRFKVDLYFYESYLQRMTARACVTVDELYCCLHFVACMMMIPLVLFVHFWFTEKKKHTKEIGRRFIFVSLLTFTHECTWTFTWCLCVCVVGFVGCLMTGLIIYLFQDFRVTLTCCADFRGFRVDVFINPASDISRLELGGFRTLCERPCLRNLDLYWSRKFPKHSIDGLRSDALTTMRLCVCDVP